MNLFDRIKNANNKNDALEFGINQLSRENKQLISVLMELSPICDFSCPFCYSKKTPEELDAEGKSIRSFSYWKTVLDQLYDMDVLSVGFTGGECLIYPEFAEVYSYAIKKGFLVGIISNMSVLSDDTLKLFIKYPPKNISVTIYGATDETYKNICGLAAFSQVKNNLQRLKNAGINFKLQTTVCKENVFDMPAISELAKDLDTTYMYTESLINFQNCDEDIVFENSVDEKAFLNIVKEINKETPENINRPIKPAPYDDSGFYEKGTKCSAGQNSAFINFEGYMQPCVSFSEIKVSTDEYSVAECWVKIVEQCKEIPNIPECNGCIHWGRCRHCFAMHYYDTHDFTKPSPRLCFKLLHPEEAARIEAYYEEHGELPPIED